jgi:hypothetical protein
LAGGVINKLTEDKNKLAEWWKNKGNLAHPPSHPASASVNASEHCNWAWLIMCMHLGSLWAESSLSSDCIFIAGSGHFGANMVSPCIANVKRVQHPMQWMFKCQFGAAFFFYVFFVSISTHFLKCKKEKWKRIAL